MVEERTGMGNLLDKFPIDFEALGKGSLIPTEMLEQILGAAKGSNKYAFGLMGLQRAIHERTIFTAKIIEEGLRILTDQEAAIHNAGLFKKNIAGAFYRHEKALEVDVLALGDEDRKKHENRLQAQGFILSSIGQAMKVHKIGKDSFQIMEKNINGEESTG